jgi:two-component system nitrate/nitrite response regulator NarL
MRRVSVVLADRQPVVVCGLVSLLAAFADFRVVAGCYDGNECIEIIRQLSPDIALLDTSMPGLSGLDILAAVTLDHLTTRIVFFTEYADDRDLTIAIARGAYGVIFKDSPPEFLVQCLRDIGEGQRFFPLTNYNAIANNGNVLTLLTERERQIMHLVSEGLSNKEVGRRLNVSDGTIKVHLQHIYRKLAINNRTALAALAFSHIEE